MYELLQAAPFIAIHKCCINDTTCFGDDIRVDDQLKVDAVRARKAIQSSGAVPVQEIRPSL
jgi:hypothetical protein